MNIPEIPLAQSLLQIFKTQNIQNIVISPGSRNAPLTIGFASDDFFTCYSIADERSAGFFAIGISLQTQTPTAIVCTSGSAVLNYYPAVAEAFYSQIPLIVVSADRPKNKIDIGDGQTIRQENVLANHTLFNANLTEIASKDNDILVQKAINVSIEKKGPVHINVPFEEPLYNTVDKYSYSPYWIEKEKKIPIDYNCHQLKDIWQKSSKKMVIIGASQPNTLSTEVIELLGNDPTILVLTEITSNTNHHNFVKHIDTLITNFSEQEIEEFQPDLLITIGGMVVSKRIKTILRQYTSTKHYHIDPLRAYDTFGYLTQHIANTPDIVFREIFQLETQKSNYRDVFLEKLKKNLQKGKKYLEKIPFSDLKVFEKISQYIPEKSLLHISNSASIRYAMLFDFLPTIQVHCNRGTSGIDGCTSTAIGAACTTEKSTTIITGDISFFYDSNALWNNYIPKNFKIILLNNGGGGIFRILPGHRENTLFHTFFETQHQLTAQYLAKTYYMDYLKAENLLELEEGLKKLYNNNEKPTILEIFTPTKNNEKIQKQYFKSL